MNIDKAEGESLEVVTLYLGRSWATYIASEYLESGTKAKPILQYTDPRLDHDPFVGLDVGNIDGFGMSTKEVV